MGTKKCPHKDFENCHPCGNVMNFLHAHTDRHTHTDRQEVQTC